ncbi:MAG: hypothetical protein JNK15_14575 [Planctomycetes bacterium]|nr:hypothetical protein [Planctomycetota bacterium]
MSLRLLLVLGLAVPPFAGCGAGPRERSPIAAAERVLAVEFGPRRATAFGMLPERVRAGGNRELRRLGSLPAPTATLAAEAERVPAAARDLRGLAKAEAARRPHVPDGVLPDAKTVGQALADGLADLPALLWPRRPLAEIDDARHRTDPNDRRPETSFWQRLRRRLLP